MAYGDPLNPYGNPAYSPPFGGLYEGNTSGVDDDDDNDDQAAEIIAEQTLDEAERDSGDTGALSLQIPSLGDITGTLSRMLGFAPPPAKVAAVQKKVQKKIAIKAPARQAKAAARPVLRLPSRIMQPIMGPVAGRAPVNNLNELKQRVQWAQLASLTAAPLSVGAGITTATTLPVTRTGWVLDWVTNQGSQGLVIASLTYAQQPYAIFNATPMEAWAPAAANPTPIPPLYVTMPATLNVSITNPTAAALIATFTMSGIPDEAVMTALQDAEVRRFLADRGMQLARSYQGGG